MPAFADKLLAAAERNRSLLCVGLDPDPARMPVADVAEFNRAIIEATVRPGLRLQAQHGLLRGNSAFPA